MEIIRPNEGDGVSWEEKLARYHELGVKELVRFDPESSEGTRVRVWDRIRDDLVERQLTGARTPCLTLGLNWTVCPVESEPAGLRLMNDAGQLLDVPEEASERARRAAAERAESAEARIRELEEQLRRAESGKDPGRSG